MKLEVVPPPLFRGLEACGELVAGSLDPPESPPRQQRDHPNYVAANF